MLEPQAENIGPAADALARLQLEPQPSRDPNGVLQLEPQPSRDPKGVLQLAPTPTPALARRRKR